MMDLMSRELEKDEDRFGGGRENWETGLGHLNVLDLQVEMSRWLAGYKHLSSKEKPQLQMQIFGSLWHRDKVV